MLGVARRVLERSQGSATGAIIEALRQVEGPGTSDASREGAGFTCLALRGEEVYLAVQGSGVVIVRQGGRLRRVAPPPNVSVSDGQLHRYTLAPGDALLACSSRIDHLAPLQVLGTAFSANSAETLRKLSLITQEEEGFTALLLSRL